MGAKAEISWKGVSAEGVKREVYVQHVGDAWKFYRRERRYDNWQSLPKPPLEDWLELLDAVRRRINRRLLRPEEEEKVLKSLRERFPEWKEEE